MKKSKILVTRKLFENAMNFIDKDKYEIVTWHKDEAISNEALLELSKDADGMISMLSDKINKEVIDNAPNLKVISNYAVGYNNIDVAYAKSKNIKVGNTPDVLTEATADLGLALLLSVSRKIIDSTSSPQDWGQWSPDKFLGQSLMGKTLGIVGFGRIGQAFARKCALAFNMKVIFHSRTEKSFSGQYKADQVSMETLLKESDVISLHCPLTDDTKELFGKSEFEKMKESAILINTARGEVINQDDLIAAIENEQIWGAGLDVTVPEPLPMSSKLHSFDNVVITPHIGSADRETREAMCVLALNNVIAALESKEMPAEV